MDLQAILPWVFVALPYPLAVLAALVLAWLLVAMTRNVHAGVGAAWFMTLIQAQLTELPTFNAAFTVNMPDLLFVPLLLIAILRLALRKAPPLGLVGYAWIAFGSLVALSLARGVLANGSAAGPDVRPVFFFWSTVLYILTFPVELRDATRGLKWLTLIASLLMALAVYRWIAGAIDPSLSDEWEAAGAHVRFRVLGSDHALVMSFGILVALSMFVRNRVPKLLWIVPALGASVLLLQHRSVWLATFAGVVALTVVCRRQLGQLALPVAAAGGVVLLAAAFVLNFGGAATEAISTSAQSALATDRGTQVDRVLGWQQLLKSWVGTGGLDLVIGQPYGSGYVRQVLGRTHGFSPHNNFVQSLLRTGPLGVLLWVACVSWAALALGKAASREGVDDWPLVALVAIFGSCLVYFIAYQNSWMHGVVVGFGIGLARSLRLHDGLSLSTQGDAQGSEGSVADMGAQVGHVR